MRDRRLPRATGSQLDNWETKAIHARRFGEIGVLTYSCRNGWGGRQLLEQALARMPELYGDRQLTDDERSAIALAQSCLDGDEATTEDMRAIQHQVALYWTCLDHLISLQAYARAAQDYWKVDAATALQYRRRAHEAPKYPNAEEVIEKADAVFEADVVALINRIQSRSHSGEDLPSSPEVFQFVLDHRHVAESMVSEDERRASNDVENSIVTCHYVLRFCIKARRLLLDKSLSIEDVLGARGDYERLRRLSDTLDELGQYADVMLNRAAPLALWAQEAKFPERDYDYELGSSFGEALLQWTESAEDSAWWDEQRLRHLLEQRNDIDRHLEKGLTTSVVEERALRKADAEYERACDVILGFIFLPNWLAGLAPDHYALGLVERLRRRQETS